MARRTKKKETLTTACAALLKVLEKDLRAAVEDDESAQARWKAEWNEAKKAGRTGKTFQGWLDGELTQVGASWILSCVFVRFVEDNGLIEMPVLSGPIATGDEPSGWQSARDAEADYYGEHPAHAEVEYLEHVFRELGRLPGMADLFDARHAALWRQRPRPEGGRALVEFFRAVDDATGALRWDFTDPERKTRFLGDLYQDLSESARKNFALLQTPDFVEAFILDRTLEPALDTFGLEGFRMIDPTCGSGHFLLGAFERILARRRDAEPGAEQRDLVRKSLDAVHGVDVNPFAVCIARFRLLVSALRACDVQQLEDAPDFEIHVAVGDSLLHGPRFADTRGRQQDLYGDYDLGHLYSLELPDKLRSILGRQYHAVVGNPPYITPKDKALNLAYREKYGSCHRLYALSVPFLERSVEMASEAIASVPAGFVGQITANSFMKREFGKKLIEEYFPRWDLTHVVDTSGAHIPAHGTPTVILLLRNQFRGASKVRAVLGIRGEPKPPEEPSRGLVWTAIVRQLDMPGSESAFVSVEDVDISTFHRHPWSLGGGGASGLRQIVEERATACLSDRAEEIGFGGITGEDDVFVSDELGSLQRMGVESVMPFGKGDQLRDWRAVTASESVWPYNTEFEPELTVLGDIGHHVLWAFRTTLRARKRFSRPVEEVGTAWYEWRELYTRRLRSPLSISFAFVATHNHFVLDRGGKVFKQSAPIIKLRPDATEHDHYALLALLNSSLAAFWARQTLHCKGNRGEGGGITAEAWEKFLEWDGTKMKLMPIFEHTLSGLARSIESAVARMEAAEDQEEYERERSTSWFLQEELDWALYKAAGLADSSLAPGSMEPIPEFKLGQRAFEIAMARSMEAGELRTQWFGRHGIQPASSLPEHWPSGYRRLVEARLAAIRSDRRIGLMERPEHKRRWSAESWDARIQQRATDRLLDALESLVKGVGAGGRALTLNELAEIVQWDRACQEMAPIVTGSESPYRGRLLPQLLASQHVPFLSSLYFKESGLRSHCDWEATWHLQREEDDFLERQDALLTKHFGSSPADQRRAREHVACWKTSNKLTKEKDLTAEAEANLRELKARWMQIDAARKAAIGGETPPVPPKYKPADFQSPTYWRLRGKLDVPKERFISYPHCSPDGDDSLLIGWAGWNHEQRAAALAQILEARKSEGWTGDRLAPILLGIDELIFWLHQWHGDAGKDYQAFLEQECAAAGLTLEDVRSWTPPTKPRGRHRKADG